MQEHLDKDNREDALMEMTILTAIGIGCLLSNTPPMREVY